MRYSNAEWSGPGRARSDVWTFIISQTKANAEHATYQLFRKSLGRGQECRESFDEEICIRRGEILRRVFDGRDRLLGRN